MAKRIVIADDSATIQRAFAMTFGAEDVTLVAARSAEEGLALTRQLQPELVIADGMMPGRSGYDLCAQIKADPSLLSTAVYVLASAQQPYDDSRGRQCGADGHFLKPFDTTAIIEKVHEALTRGPTEVPQPAAAPLSDEFGPPVPSEVRSIPSGLTTSLASASDDDEYGEISVDMSPPSPEEDASETEIEYAPVAAAARTALMPAFASSPSTAFASSPSTAYSTSPSTAYSTSPSAGTPAPAPLSMSAGPSPAAAAPAASSMRPSLIPGIRPGAVAPARPGAAPPRPTATGAGAAPASRPPAPVARTLMGLPAANIPIPGTSRPAMPPMSRPTPPPSSPMPLSALSSTPASAPPSSSSAARPVPVAPPTPTPAPLFSAVPAMPVTSPTSAPTLAPNVSAMVSAVVGAAVDQKIAAISARGPEYEAIAKLSREIIEQIVWEVVPELAEVIIREHVERHVRA